MHSVPPRRPKRPPARDPNGTSYWDERDLEAEILRTFQICVDCRMCVTYCGSFPALFDAVDREIDGQRAEGVETLGPGVITDVVDHCWQCKLCYLKCPYTADEESYELVDFPRLLARVAAVRARRDGIGLVDRILGEPRLLGRATSPVAGLTNVVNENRLVRRLAERGAGISTEFPLPPFASTPFPGWIRRHQPGPRAGDAGTVVLFSTCYGDYNFPEIPRAAVRVLEHNGLSVIRPDDLDCCGMPNLDAGDVAAAATKMRRNIEILLPHVRAGRRIVVVGPTCGYAIRREWPEYVGTPEAAEVAAAAVDVMELLHHLRREGTLDDRFATGLGTVAYHAACHLRAQKIGYPAARLLERVPDTDVTVVERCAAVDGTWGMKAAHYDEGRRYSKRLIESIRDVEPDMVVTDCALAGLRVQKELSVTPVHPVVAFAMAYGLEEEGP